MYISLYKSRFIYNKSNIFNSLLLSLDMQIAIFINYLFGLLTIFGCSFRLFRFFLSLFFHTFFNFRCFRWANSISHSTAFHSSFWDTLNIVQLTLRIQNISVVECHSESDWPHSAMDRVYKSPSKLYQKHSNSYTENR